MRDAIFDCERDLLDTIEYRLQVDLPYHYIVEVVNKKSCAILRDRNGA